MGVKKQALKISEWRQNGEEFRYEGSPRKAHMVIIGTMEQPGGTESYIAEGIFDDIMPLIEQKKVTVHVDIYSDPMIVLEKDGKLIPHNLNVQYLKEDLIAAFDDKEFEQDGITKSNQMRALVELRSNLYADFSLGNSIKILRRILTQKLQAEAWLNYDLISLALKEKYLSLDDADELANMFKSYTKEELISTYGGLMEKFLTNAVKIEPAKTLVEDNVPVEKIEEALKDEIARRFFSGEIR